jgi:hypothetical protein
MGMDDTVLHAGAKRKRVEAVLPESIPYEAPVPRHKTFGDGSHTDRGSSSKRPHASAARAETAFDGDKPILDVSKYLRADGNLSKVLPAHMP